MVRLVALDIDHNLTRPDGRICEAAILALRAAQAQGMHLALVSARPPEGVDAIANLIGGDTYRVSYLGAVIRSPQRVELWRRAMKPEPTLAIAHFADQRGIGIALTIDDVEYHSRGYAGKAWTAMLTIERAELMLTSGKTPVLMAVEGYEWARELYAFCRDTLGGTVHATRHLLPDRTYTSTTVVDPQAEKGHGVAGICEILAVSRDDVLAIGDNESDGSMFRAAAVNASAAHVAPYLDGDGVVWALQRFAGIRLSTA
jgi:hydroxymethylpyrimidine pyrophosphatase-like HAD family hydrolase